MLKIKIFLIYAPVVLLLSACSTLTFSGFKAAMNLDPLHSNPEYFQAAAAITDDIVLKPGDMRLTFSYDVKNNPEQSVNESFPLLVKRYNSNETFIALKPDESFYVAHLSPDDANKMRQAQSQILDLKSHNVEGLGQMSVLVDGGCYKSPEMPENIYIRTFIRTDQRNNFVQMTRRKDLLDYFSEEERVVFIKKFKSCSN